MGSQFMDSIGYRTAIKLMKWSIYHLRKIKLASDVVACSMRGPYRVLSVHCCSTLSHTNVTHTCHKYRPLQETRECLRCYTLITRHDCTADSHNNLKSIKCYTAIQWHTLLWTCFNTQTNSTIFTKQTVDLDRNYAKCLHKINTIELTIPSQASLKWHLPCLWISYHKSPPVLGFGRRSHKQPIPCPLHGRLI